MLRSLPREFSLSQRLLAIVAFTTLTAIGAQVEVRIGDYVPFTMQVFAALLAGMVLGARDGALSQLLYIGLLLLNFPVASNWGGMVRLVGPTGGYIFALAPAAFAVGWLVQHGADRAWQRWLAGLVGVVIIYSGGLLSLMRVTHLPLQEALMVGVVPFIGFDLVKAALASTLSEGARRLLR